MKKKHTVRIRFNTDCTDGLHYWRAIIDGVEHLAINIHVYSEMHTTKDFLHEINNYKWHVTCESDRLEWKDGELSIY